MTPSIPLADITLTLQDTDWTTVDRLEIRGSRDVVVEDEYSRTVEDNHNPEFYSIFIHQQTGSSWIADRRTLSEAREFAGCLSDEHELYLREFV